MIWNSFQGDNVFSELAFSLIYQTENKLSTIFVFCMGMTGSLAVILLMNSSLFLNSVKERGVSVLLLWVFFFRWNLLFLLFGWIWRWFVLPIACFSPTSSSEIFFTVSHWVMRSSNYLFMFPNRSDFTTGIFTSSISLFIISWNTSNSSVVFVYLRW